MRVLRVARFDGMGILVFAGFFAVLSAAGGDRVGAIFGLLIAGAGAFELHGGSLLEHADHRGMNWLIGSQVFLMASVLAYCEFRMSNADVALLRSAVTSDVKAQLASIGWTVDQFINFSVRLVGYGVAIGTVLYQGGMTIYYIRRRQLVLRAIEEFEF